MKLCPLLEQLLRKHKLIGTPAKAIKIEEETKESILRSLKSDMFFAEIEECETKGISLCYDELVEYTLPAASKKSSTEEAEHIQKELKVIFRELVHSSYLSVHGDKYYLHIKYNEEPDSVLAGPVKAAENVEDIKEFKSRWGSKVEHRKFNDGKVRVCVSFTENENTVRYQLLSKIFRIKTVEDKKTDNTEREGRILTPTVPADVVNHSYNEANKKKASEAILRALDSIRATFPISILESLFTGSYQRKTRASIENRTKIYLKVGRGHSWPKDNKVLSDASITALNGVLGKSLEYFNKTQGISKDNTLYSNLYGEDFEFIFDVEGEQKLQQDKYYLMNFRTEYERFFQEVSEKNKVFPRLCALIKNLLHAHGIYPHYITDKAVEIICYRTGYKAKTLAGGLRAVISTQYARGYTLDIRRGKNKIRSKETGKIEVTHKLGAYSISLPDEKIFSQMNDVFKNSLKHIESIAGVTKDGEVSPVFREIFIPSVENVDFSLSRVPLQGYQEISHYNKQLGGSYAGADDKKCLNSLIQIGCTPYFCRTGVLHVQVGRAENAKLAIGASILLTGMKFIKIRK